MMAPGRRCWSLVPVPDSRYFVTALDTCWIPDLVASSDPTPQMSPRQNLLSRCNAWAVATPSIALGTARTCCPRNAQVVNAGRGRRRLSRSDQRLIQSFRHLITAHVCLSSGKMTVSNTSYTLLADSRRNFTSFVQPTSLLGCGRVQGPHQK